MPSRHRRGRNHRFRQARIRRKGVGVVRAETEKADAILECIVSLGRLKSEHVRLGIVDRLHSALGMWKDSPTEPVRVSEPI
jgi:hypothetical protein